MKANPVWEVRAHNNHKKDNGGEKRTKMNEIELALLSTSAQFIVYKTCDELRIVSSKNVEFMIQNNTFKTLFLAPLLNLKRR